MFKYVVKRLLLALFILVGVSLILYTIIRIMPVNVIVNKYNATHQGSAYSEAELQAILDRYNLGDNSFGGIIYGWWKWITAFAAGDLGVSLVAEGRNVGDLIFENMGVSFAVSLIALVLELIIAIPLGIKCACNQYGKLDYTVTVLTMIGISFPSFFFAIILNKIFAVDFGWLATSLL